MPDLPLLPLFRSAQLPILEELDGVCGPVVNGPALRRSSRLPRLSRLSSAVGLVMALTSGLTAQAGDLLRGGAGANVAPGSPSAHGTPAGGLTSAAAAAAAANARDALARNSQAVAAAQALQAAARNAALASARSLLPKGLPAVPNGLAPNGLQIAPGVLVNPAKPAAGVNASLWSGAKLPTQTTSGGQTTVTITQTAPQAMLNWQTFNVGKHTTVDFDQKAGGSDAGKWIAFNKINDPTGNPTQILGNIHADGQVYLINQNGIIFGGSSQINVHTLVASSLPINGNLILQGLLNNPDNQFLFSSLPIATLSGGTTPPFNPVVSGSPVTDPSFTVKSPSHTIARPLTVGSVPVVTVNSAPLTAGADYTLTANSAGKTVVTLTLAGLAKAGGHTVSIAYTALSHHSAAQFTDATFKPTLPTIDLGHFLASGSTPVVKVAPAGSSPTTLVSGTDYNLTQSTFGQPIVTLTAAGLAKATTSSGAAAPISITYSQQHLGDVIVEAGAQLTSPTTPEHVGGRIALVGANVSNAGSISTPDGQTILAAGDQIAFSASADASLRGLYTYVGAVAPGHGSASNTGIIEAPRADVTLTGKTVSQLGIVDSSTSVSLNGSINLLASYDTAVVKQGKNPAYYSQSDLGALTLGPDSITQILPELSSTETEVGTQLALPSQVNLQGQSIHLGTNAQLLAPNATVTAAAGNSYVPNTGHNVWLGDVLSIGGQIYLDSGASIDVSGSIVSAPVSENIVSAQILGPQVANDPLQRAGILRGETIQVDIRNTGVYNGQYWVGTPLADVSGYAGLIQRPVGELTTAGGSVSLNAGGSVVLQAGSHIDVSGGAINYEGGVVQTTRVMSGGLLYDISKATPDQLYQGIYTGAVTIAHPKYGLSESFMAPLRLNGAHFEESYTEGANGGSISISAPAMALDGTLKGQTFAGPRQRQVAPGQSSLTLSFAAEKAAGIFFSPTPPSIIFRAATNLPPAAPFALNLAQEPAPLREDRQSLVVLSPDLLGKDGFGALTVNNGDGAISVAAGVTLAAPVAGSISLVAANLTVDGNVSAPGGSISLTATDFSPYAFATLPPNSAAPAPNLGRGQFTLGPNATLSAAGLIVDDRLNSPAANTLPLVTNGGSISIASYSASLATGSVIDVSGGVAVSGANKMSYGKGGSISISAGEDPNIPALIGGKLHLGSTLTGYSGTAGGSLSILAPLIQIGGVTSENANTLLLDPAFFSQGGFASFSLTGLGEAIGKRSDLKDLPGVLIAPGTTLNPVARNWVATKNSPTSGGITLQPALLDQAQRTGVSLKFSAPGVVDPTGVIRGDFVMGNGASITTDPLGSVTISAQTATILGSITAPGGAISISGAGTNNNTASDPGELFPGHSPIPVASVYLGPNAVLSTAGVTVLTPDVYNLPTGAVLPGGSITLTGNIVAAAGSVLNVSGTSGVLYLPQAQTTLENAAFGSFHGAPVTPVQVASNAGSITLVGKQELFSEATLLGQAGGPSALGGTLTVSSGRYIREGDTDASLPTDPTLVVTQSGPVLPAGQPAGVGKATLGANGQALAPHGEGHIAVSSFDSGGFNAIALGGTVQFASDVSISARGSLTVADGGIIIADGAVTLSAPHVALGLPFQPPLTPGPARSPFNTNGTAIPIDPTFGPGSLTVIGSLIDIGNLSLQNIGQANFIAAGGDIRGNGTLDVAGHISLTAGQIYPATGVVFTIAAYDPNITVAAAVAGSPTVTLASATLPPGFGKGSSLLGSTVTKIDGKVVTLAAGANATISAKTTEVFDPGAGSITVASSGSRSLPLSAGGTLGLYASNISQGGVLRAPMGSIHLGWDAASGAAPIDLITNAPLPSTQQLTLRSGSITSVSTIDPTTGQGLILPYGANPTGTSWIDPTGQNITSGGIPGKTITLGGASISDQAGAVVDLRGGGDLYAYRFVTGANGTLDYLGSGANWNNNTSYTAGQIVSYKGASWVASQQTIAGQSPTANQYWTQLPTSYAVLPGYQAGYAPYAPFNAAVNDPGYVSDGLALGEQVYLAAGSGLAAGVYTLLPARYALLPGAFLITPQGALPTAGRTLPDGSSLVSGYVFSGLSQPGGVNQPLVSSFQVESRAVLATKAQYDSFVANDFLRQGAVENKAAVPRLPIDAGQLVFQASRTLDIRGVVQAQAPAGGQAGLVDISSPTDIYISSGGKTGPAGSLTLDSAELSSFGAESLLVGGIRTFSASGISVNVQTNNIEVNNSGSALTGPDVILAANNKLKLDAGALVTASGSLAGTAESLVIHDATQLGGVSDTLTFDHGGTPISFPKGTPGNDTLTATVGGTITLANGDTTTFAAGTPFTLAAGSSITLAAGGALTFQGGSGGAIPLLLGDGTLLRVTSANTAPIHRSGVASSQAPSMIIGAGATISGSSVVLDSTHATTLDPHAVISAQNIALDSGQISLLLAHAGAPPTSNTGLTLSSSSLATLERGAQSLSLLSYSSIDIYGTGTIGSASLGSLALHAGEIRGMGASDGSTAANVTFTAQNIVLDNSANAAQLDPFTAPQVPIAGALSFAANNISLGAHQVDILGYDVALSASGGLLFHGAGGLGVQGDLTISNTPVITGSTGANQKITALGALTINAAGGHSGAVGAGGLGASLTLQGSTIAENGNITLPSGSVTLHATGTQPGDGVTVGGVLDVSGRSQSFFDLVETTGGGAISLISDSGSISLAAGSRLAVGATSANAGSISISAPHGEFTIDPKAALLGNGGLGGSFSLDVNDIAAVSATGAPGSVGALDTLLKKGGFDNSIAIRDRSDAVVTVENAAAHTFSLSADQGSIDVTGTIDASGITGGSILLQASGDVTLEAGSVLTVAGQTFSSAGKGGAISIEAGSAANGVAGNGSVNILAGSKLDLSVADNTTSSAAAGDFTGTLHLRAPQINGNKDVRIAQIDGKIVGASAILVEGFQIYAPADGSIDSVKSDVLDNGQNFAGHSAAITARLLAGQSSTDAAALLAKMVVAPGAEIVNLQGNLTLASDWDLSQYRFGSSNAPGFLTLRASRDLVFTGSLSDGFASAAYNALLLPQNTALPINFQSWSYNLTAGADLSAVDFSRTNVGGGSLLLGKFDPHPFVISNPAKGTIANVIPGFYQVIRTGSGDITISAGGNVELLNQFATVYTAGTQVADATMGGTFVVPILDENSNPSGLGASPTKLTPGYAPQYTEAGGNVKITAGLDIEHLTQDLNGNVIMDSESELPNNWLYRRGYVDGSGSFGSNTKIRFGGDLSESTTWWVDFSNFFEGVGALGGGNVTLTAGHDIANVDAVIPTNARMPGLSATGNLAPNADKLVELGGGDLSVRAGNDLNAGVYYVERGQGLITAGRNIVTNSTRAPIGGQSTTAGAFTAPVESWLPTTFFLGKGSLDISAGGDILLGPVVNPFLLPEGLANSIWYKTYFSTYATTDAVSVSSLSGNITFREAALSNLGHGSILETWLVNMDGYIGIPQNPRSFYQPWLRLNEATLDNFGTSTQIMPATLRATAFSGNIDIVGNLLLAPSPTGSLDLAARGSINGFASTGNVNGFAWSASVIDLSDSDPTLLPGVTSPLAYQGFPGIGTNATQAGLSDSLTDFMANFFAATTQEAAGASQTARDLHAPGLLHATDADPVHLYAASSNISGVRLYTPKDTRISAGGDITDVAFYLQNNSAKDISVISAGGDIVAYDPSSPARVAAQTGPGDNVLDAALSGDLLIAGPGTLEVLAGRNLNLGGPGPGEGGASNAGDNGLASVGNSASPGNAGNPNGNPFLPATGADIVAAAGIGHSAGLEHSQLDFDGFASQFLQSSGGSRYIAELGDLVGAGNSLNADSLASLKPAQRDLLALDVFYLALRDAGRDHNDPSSPDFNSYAAGFAAITTLLPTAGEGDINVTGRNIKTESGGNINLLAPGGQITVGLNSGAQTDVTNLGIVTQNGGNISIFANGDVNVGTSRVFTLHGGNEIIWSSTGNIDAGSSSKTVQSAPPTRVLIDPQSGVVETDLAGLATGGGIGVLQTIVGVPPGNVDLIAPTGAVDAGDAGIRVSGNLSISAVQVLNAAQIQVGGTSAGVPSSPAVAAPNLAALATASNANGAANNSAQQVAKQPPPPPPTEEAPSMVVVQVIGYGGGDDDDDSAQ